MSHNENCALSFEQTSTSETHPCLIKDSLIADCHGYSRYQFTGQTYTQYVHSLRDRHIITKFMTYDTHLLTHFVNTRTDITLEQLADYMEVTQNNIQASAGILYWRIFKRLYVAHMKAPVPECIWRAVASICNTGSTVRCMYGMEDLVVAFWKRFHPIDSFRKSFVIHNSLYKPIFTFNDDITLAVAPVVIRDNLIQITYSHTKSDFTTFAVTKKKRLPALNEAQMFKFGTDILTEETKRTVNSSINNEVAPTISNLCGDAFDIGRKVSAAASVLDAKTPKILEDLTVTTSSLKQIAFQLESVLAKFAQISPEMVNNLNKSSYHTAAVTSELHAQLPELMSRMTSSFTNIDEITGRFAKYQVLDRVAVQANNALYDVGMLAKAIPLLITTIRDIKILQFLFQSKQNILFYTYIFYIITNLFGVYDSFAEFVMHALQNLNPKQSSSGTAENEAQSSIEDWTAPISGILCAVVGFLIHRSIPSGNKIDRFVKANTIFFSMTRTVDCIPRLFTKIQELFHRACEYFLEANPSDLAFRKIMDAEQQAFKKWTEDVAKYSREFYRSRIDTDIDLRTTILFLRDEATRFNHLFTDPRWPPYYRNIFNINYRDCMKLADLADRAHAYKPVRRDLYTLHISGVPRIGKTKICSDVAIELVKALGLPLTNCIYSRGESDHWDDYHGQPVIYMDDFGQWRGEKANMVLQEFVSLRGNAPLITKQADLSDKGRPLDSWILMCSSNVDYVDTSPVTTGSAIHQRRERVIRMILKDEYWTVDYHGELCANKKKMKLAEQYGAVLCGMEYPEYEFQFLPKDLANYRPSDRYPIMSYQEMISILRDECIDFHQQQKEIVDNLMSKLAYNITDRLNTAQVGSDDEDSDDILTASAPEHLAVRLAREHNLYDRGFIISPLFEEHYPLTFVKRGIGLHVSTDHVPPAQFWRMHASITHFSMAEQIMIWEYCSEANHDDTPSTSIFDPTRIKQMFYTTKERCEQWIRDHKEIAAGLAGLAMVGSVVHMIYSAWTFLESGEDADLDDNIDVPGWLAKQTPEATGGPSGDSTTRHAPRSKVVTKTPTTLNKGQSGDQNSQELRRLILRHLYRIKIGKRRMNALAFNGQNLLLTHHFIADVNNGEAVELTGEGPYALTFLFRKELVQRINDEDLVIYGPVIQLRPAPMFSRHCIREKDVGVYKRFQGELVSRDATEDTVYVYPTEFVRRDLEPNLPTEHQPDDIRYKVANGFAYAAPTKRGDCGAIGIAHNAKLTRKLVSFHVSGFTEKFIGGLGIILTQEMLEKHLQLQYVDINEAHFSSILDSEEDARCLIPTGYTIIGTVLKGKGVFSPTKTSIKPSLIHGMVTEPTTAPSVLAPRDPRNKSGQSPLRKGLVKYTKPVIGWAPHIVDLVAKHIQANQAMMRCLRPDMQFMSMNLVINGHPTYEHYDPINLDTSPGYPYVLTRPTGSEGKFYLFDALHEPGERTEYAMKPELIHVTWHNLMALSTGHRPAWIWTHNLKDERRPLHKIESASTRLFTMGPTDFTLICRALFLDFIAAFYASHTKTFSAVGVDPDSPSWTFMYESLREMSSVGGDGDYSAFDGTLEPELMLECIQSMAIWTWNNVERNDPKFPTYIITFPGDDINFPPIYMDKAAYFRACYIIAVELIHTWELAQDVLHVKHQGNPSGCPLTVVLNTIVGQMYLECCYLRLVEKGMFEISRDLNLPGKGDGWVLSSEAFSLRQFDKSVRTFIYGDDNIYAIEAETSKWFNPQTIADELLEHGIDYTPASKTGANVLKSIEELQFLKRKIRDHPAYPQYKLAPIDTNTIYEMINWIREAPDEQEQLFTNIEGALRFAYHHGLGFYSEFLTKVNKALLDKGLEMQFPHEFDALDRRWLGSFQADTWLA